MSEFESLSDEELQEVNGGAYKDFRRIYAYCLKKQLGRQDITLSPEKYVSGIIESLFPGTYNKFIITHMEDEQMDDRYILTLVDLSTGNKTRMYFNTDEVLELLISKYGEE